MWGWGGGREAFLWAESYDEQGTTTKIPDTAKLLFSLSLEAF